MSATYLKPASLHVELQNGNGLKHKSIRRADERSLTKVIESVTVLAISVSTNPILCTKSTKLTMLFYYIKMRTSSSPYHPFLQLTGALK